MILKNRIITFTFSVTLFEKSECWQTIPSYILKFFHKINLLKAQVLKTCRTLVFKKVTGVGDICVPSKMELALFMCSFVFSLHSSRRISTRSLTKSYQFLANILLWFFLKPFKNLYFSHILSWCTKSNIGKKLVEPFWK